MPHIAISKALREMQHSMQAALPLNKTLDNITILAVSKGQSALTIEEAHRAGLDDFGENYVQEALSKILQLTHLPIRWHFIGALQHNKVNKVARYFDWVHTIDRIDIANKLNTARAKEALPPLNICIQVNLGFKKQAGVAPSDLHPLSRHILTLPALRLRGLMIIPDESPDSAVTLGYFQTLKQLQLTLSEDIHYPLDTLSMGMSKDYLLAIEAGSTLVRIGRALFPNRHIIK